MSESSNFNDINEHQDTDTIGNYSTDECAIADKLIADYYDVLIRISRSKRKRMDVSDTLRTTDILHEAYFKVSKRESWNSPEHFIRCASLAMRCVIVDHARKKLAIKHGAGSQSQSIDDDTSLMPEFSETPEQVVAISNLLDSLADKNARWMRIVDARYFSGMTETETAEILGLSARTVRRDWRDAREWIASELKVS